MTPQRLLLGFLAPLLLAIPSHAQSDDPVPVQEVVFFKSGVSYVEHEGRVTGSETMHLRFQKDQMKDVLKSLVLQDFDGGRVGTITYPSQDPLSRRLQEFQVNLSDPMGLGSLINELRGEPIEVATDDGPIQGTAFSAEKTNGPNGEDQWVVNLYSDGTLTSVSLDDVRSIEVQDPQLRQEMKQALETVAGNRDTERQTMDLSFAGQGERRVRIGYVVKAPVWKTSYRLLLPEDGTGSGQLQGWAIVENQTDADWNGIDLALVSGRPVSFVQDLYTPTYVDRPVVSPTPDQPLQPTRHEEGRTPSPKQQRGQAMRSAEAAASTAQRQRPQSGADASFALSQGVQSAVEAAAEGAFFQYSVQDVSLPRHESAMLPIVTANVEVERVSVYDPSLHNAHPLRGARIENTTGHHLAGGPVTVLDEGSYGGDARLADTPPGDTRFLSYALHQDVLIDRGDGTTEQRVATGKIVGGVLTVSRKRIATRTYTIENDGDTNATIIVEHPRRSGWSLTRPDPVEQTSEVYRFRTSVGARDTEDLVVKQEHVDQEETRLVDMAEDRLFYYARQDGIPEDVQEALRKAADLQQSVSKTAENLERSEQKLGRLRDAQSRIRSNLEAVTPDTEYHGELLEKLKSSETDIEAVQERIDELDDQKAQAEQKLRRYLEQLDVR